MRLTIISYQFKNSIWIKKCSTCFQNVVNQMFDIEKNIKPFISADTFPLPQKAEHCSKSDLALATL